MASGNDTKKCVLHVDSKVAYNEKGILLFNEKSLEKCKKAQTVYESRGSSKYKAVQLPMVPDGCSGYHVKCYSSYTSVSKQEISAAQPSHEHVDLNGIGGYSDETHPSSQSGTDVADRTLRSGTKASTSSVNTRTGVTKDALAVENAALLRKIHKIDFVAKEVRYHNSCRTELSDKAKSINKKKENEKKVFFGRDWCSRESTVRGPYQKVISYTLHGDAKNASIFNRYYSLLRDISLTAQRDYPGWIIRIYHDIPDGRGPAKEAHDQLCQVYCQFDHVDLCSVPLLIERIGNNTTPVDPASLQRLNPRMFRYLVMLDPNADVFISRDVDSLIWRREVDAVEEWLRSNYTFHVMRHHTSHQSAILAGMWGAKIWQRRDLIEGLMRALIVSGQQQIKFQDQLSLVDIVWSIAKYDVMAHDTYGCQHEQLVRLSSLKVRPFPTRRDGRYYVGGAGHDLYPDKCPEVCRPPDHKDWEYC
ncbi:Uncharacterized protein APZ42_031132 [Daphnia magna]|uniref:Lactosylceramide n=1 Tax=Daphnia magna TaxID=35525 RepID=A0A164N3L0_9CRUS|nr:Uncharacterized protein APZ42_031132 [Daphnia magna]